MADAPRAPSSSPSLHHRACPLCEAACGLEIATRGDRVVSIRGDAGDPWSRGHICPKGVALADVHEDPDRLRHPVRRTKGGWERLTWEQALDEIAARLRQVQHDHGRDAVAVYQGNPTVHSYGTLLYAQGLVWTLRTRNRFSGTSVDQLPHHLAAYFMFGHLLLLPVPDIDRTSFLLVLGANPAVSNGSLMTAPGVARRLGELRERGGTVVVVDPRRTETAALADRHLFIRPGTDALLLMAMLDTIFAEGLARPGRLEALTKRLDVLRRAVAEVPAGRAAAACGLDAEVIRELARSFARAPGAVCYGRLGVSTVEWGGVCHWLVNALNLVTGNLDRAGGAMFTLPAVDAVGRTLRGRGRGGHGRWRSRVRGLPESGGELPVAVLAEEILTPGEGQVRALVTSAGNPVLSTPNGAQLDRALAGLDFMVSIDLYVNETTRHAHVILPPTSPLEHEHYDLALALVSTRNVARHSPAILPPPPGALHDWQIYLGLRQRLETGLSGRLLGRLLGLLGPERLVDVGLRAGPYGPRLLPPRLGLGLGRVKRQPRGVDLGPLVPVLPGRLATDDRLIDAAPAGLVDLLPALRDRLLGPPRGDGASLLLVGRRDLRSNNSWMHNAPRLMRGRPRCTLLIHPDDAARRGIADGARVRILSRVGAVEAPAEITDAMMPGTVSLPHGWGHDRPGVLLRVASRQPGVSMNDLTDDRAVDPASGNAVLTAVPVHVEPASSRG